MSLPPLWEHQKEAIRREAFLPGYGLFFEPGTGKSATVIHMLRNRYNAERRILRTLILCPPIVIRNWKDEWLKHSKIDPGKIVLLTGSGKERFKLFKSQAFDSAGNPTGRIFVTNYESLLMGDLFSAFCAWKTEALVADESHKCKDGTAKRTKLACELANGRKNKAGEWLHQPIPHRYCLTGTPVLNSPLDLFSQFLILDGGATFGENFFAFRARYFRDKNAGMPRNKYFPKWEIMPGSLEEISAAISAKSMHVEKHACMDLPPYVEQTRYVGMSDQQKKLYKEMKEDFLTFLDSEEGRKPISATMALTKSLRLMQITSGYVKTVDGEEITLQDTPKMAALREILEDLAPHHKVIVWAVWKENYEQIRNVCESLGLPYVEVHGGTPAHARFQRVDEFNLDPKCRVFIGHPGAGGIGINLVVASYSVFYSRNFSLEQSLQAEARNYRGGSGIHAKVTRIDLVCGETIDELVQKKLAEKIEISDKVLRDLSLEIKKQEN